MQSIRSLSFALSSLASWMTVSPSACVAANATSGISSIALGIKSPPITVPWSLPDLATKSATGSPPTTRSDFNSIFPPMSFKMSIIPVRDGLTPTPFSVISAASCNIPAATQGAAVGTVTSTALSSPVLFSSRTPWPRSSSKYSKLAPIADNRRSEWSLEGLGSITVTDTPATTAQRRIALFT